MTGRMCRLTILTPVVTHQYFESQTDSQVSWVGWVLFLSSLLCQAMTGRFVAYFVFSNEILFHLCDCVKKINKNQRLTPHVRMNTVNTLLGQLTQLSTCTHFIQTENQSTIH